MRRASSSGSITKIKDGNRRKRWRVRVTMGWETDPVTLKSKQINKTLGYFETREKAETALVNYRSCPYDLSGKNMTFEEAYALWSEDYFQRIEKSGARTVISAYTYSHSLYKMNIRDIRVYHLEECINTAYIISTQGKDKGTKRVASYHTKARMKSMFNLLFDWAYKRELIDKNYARLFGLRQDIVEGMRNNKRQIILFSQDEIEKLWSMEHRIKFADMVLIEIYSGWRPKELAELRVENVDLERGTMVGGCKTAAGKNRVVPIHPLIRDLISRRIEEANELQSEFLFNDEERQTGMNITYDKYRKRFAKVMNRLDMSYHHPHETRHTFITKAKSAGIDAYIIKLLVGHAIIDITESVYTHRTTQELIDAINKIER